MQLTKPQLKFLKLVNNRFLFSLFLLIKLPAASIAGIKVVRLETFEAEVRIKMHWLNQNPFKSIYFAVLLMAAEMSTGLLCMMYVQDEKEKLSMLVTEVHVVFKKKAVGVNRFVCLDGEKVAHAIETAKRSGEPVIVSLKSIGYDAMNREIAEFDCTWSFKLK
jgi:hypothetical protein